MCLEDLHLALCYLCDLFLCDLFLILHNISVANYADDNTPYCTGLEISNVLIKLENAVEKLLKWFRDNRINVNPDKYHLVIKNTKESFQIKIGNKTANMLLPDSMKAKWKN